MSNQRSNVGKRLRRYFYFCTFIIIIVLASTTHFDNVKHDLKLQETSIQFNSENVENMVEFIRKTVAKNDYSINVDTPTFDMEIRKGLLSNPGSIEQQEAVNAIQRSYLNISDRTLDHIRYIMMVYSGEYTYSYNNLLVACKEYNKTLDSRLDSYVIKLSGKDTTNISERCNLLR